MGGECGVAVNAQGFGGNLGNGAVAVDVEVATDIAVAEVDAVRTGIVEGGGAAGVVIG